MCTAIRRRRPDAVTRDVTHVGVRLLGQVALAMLVWFHVGLLWTHAAVGRLVEPGVALHWSVAAFVVAALWSLRRVGISLVRGRRALVLWLLVVMIHAHAVWVDHGAQIPLAPPQAIVVLVPVVAHLSVAVATLFVLTRLAQQRAARGAADRSTQMLARFAGLPAAAADPPFSPRPPPLA